MKYTPTYPSLSPEQRKDLNAKIVYLIEQDKLSDYGITQDDVFNCYTGDGGLHGLERADYRNYHDYAEAKKEIENGQFFTPSFLCRIVMESLNPTDHETVADLTCGMGSFCNYMEHEECFYGNELDAAAYKVAKCLYPNAALDNRDIRSYQPKQQFDFVVGNPPYNLKWWTDQGEILSQLFYCQKAHEFLKPLGILAVVVPRSFLADDFSDRRMIEDMRDRFDFLGQIAVYGDAFKALGVEGYDTKIQFWQKREEDAKPKPYRTDFVAELNDFPDENAIRTLTETIRGHITDAAAAKLRSVHARRAAVASGSDDFRYRVNQMLYQISIHPATKKYYPKCQEKLYEFEHQEKPDGMTWEDWARTKLTEKRVLSYLRQTLRKQSAKPQLDRIRPVKRGSNLVWVGDSPKAERSLSEAEKTPIPIHRIVTSGDIPDEELWNSFSRLIHRKARDYQRETMPFADMFPSEEIAKYLNGFSLYDQENEETIHLNEIQKHDLNLLLQKHYTLLQWEQGSGKTLAGIAAARYRIERQSAKNVWIISPAISIHNNWEVCLDNYGLPYRTISCLNDLESVKDGDWMLVTLNMLCKYRKQIKELVRKAGQNVCLIFDESDEMSNPSGKRTKAVLDCFRRARYKLLMTGTSTRNNISEIAPQLELLYNNSYNMISWAQTTYGYDRKDREAGLQEYPNNYYGDPIPAYTEGYRLFAASHLPEKITVFGVGQKTQDIYNADVLNRLLSYSVITRTFEEVTGKEIRRLHQVTVPFSDAERSVYHKAMDEFYTMRSRYFASTGNSRKDSMMALIQQITLLLRISAAPNTVAEYSGDTPTKIRKVVSMLDEWQDEIVAVGVRHKIVVDAYAEAIRTSMPDRPLFIVTGSTTTMKERRSLRTKLHESRNGILLCTQQSLPSSVNFEFVNRVILPELHYNNARMSQFYHRFIRYTSTDWKDVYFVTYAGSIESNQMQMVLAKEKLNLFMKGQEQDLDEIYERFGVDYNLMSMLMTRERDEDGNLKIHWGEQSIQ